MNPKFYDLPEEKQLSIINAALEVFAKNDYKHAVTDEIAAKAGISKGLLFFYFKNKATLYMYLFEYSRHLLEEAILDASFNHITDFFELLEYGALKKTKLLSKNPYIMDFCFRAFFSDNELITPDIRKSIQTVMDSSFSLYFSNIDMGKFREGIDPVQMLNMLTWMSQGYLYSYKQMGISPSLDTIMKEFKEWSVMFRKIAYKEEFQEQ